MELCCLCMRDVPTRPGTLAHLTSHVCRRTKLYGGRYPYVRLYKAVLAPESKTRREQAQIASLWAIDL